MSPRFVTIVLPALNEEAYIEEAIRTVTPQDAHFPYEIIVVDGGSTDRTRALVAEIARTDPHVRLLDNPQRLQSAGINLAARHAHPDTDIIVRADCHAVYPEGFVTRCVSELTARNVQSVVVPMRTVGITPFQRAAAAAQNSVLGNGGSAHRRAASSGIVEHGHHAAFNRAFFQSVGGYDESFSHNEDAELDFRICQAAGLIWLDAENAVTYFPRGSLPALARQYFKHGGGRARTILKHAVRPKPRQVAPLLLLTVCAGGVILTPASSLFLLPALAYVAACCAVGAASARPHRDVAALLMTGPAAMTMHLAWAAGFLRAALLDRPQRAPLRSNEFSDA